jgi:hypothetical protein
MKLAAVIFAALLPLLPASAQKLELKFDDLAAKATDKAEVDLDGALLRFAMQAADNDRKDDKDKKAAPGLLSGVKLVRVRHYEFDQAGSWSDKDLDAVRKQVSGTPGWSRIVNIKDKGENVEIYVLTQGDNLGGAVILAAEEKEFTVVQFEGTITLAEMKGLVDSKLAFNMGGLEMLGAMTRMSK